MALEGVFYRLNANRLETTGLYQSKHNGEKADKKKNSPLKTIKESLESPSVFVFLIWSN